MSTTYGCHPLGLVINWYGDSLDGTLARVRNTQRPIYGFFIDHSLDAITICIMCIGAGLSPMFKLDVALVVLAGYLVLSIYTYVCTILKDEFRLTYSSFGPTEFAAGHHHHQYICICTRRGATIQFSIDWYTFGVYDIGGHGHRRIPVLSMADAVYKRPPGALQTRPVKAIQSFQPQQLIPATAVRTYLEFLVTRLFGTGVDTLVLWICSHILIYILLGFLRAIAHHFI